VVFIHLFGALRIIDFITEGPPSSPRDRLHHRGTAFITEGPVIRASLGHLGELAWHIKSRSAFACASCVRADGRIRLAAARVHRRGGKVAHARVRCGRAAFTGVSSKKSLLRRTQCTTRPAPESGRHVGHVRFT